MVYCAATGSQYQVYMKLCLLISGPICPLDARRPQGGAHRARPATPIPSVRGCRKSTEHRAERSAQPAPGHPLPSRASHFALAAGAEHIPRPVHFLGPGGDQVSNHLLLNRRTGLIWSSVEPRYNPVLRVHCTIWQVGVQRRRVWRPAQRVSTVGSKRQLVLYLRCGRNQVGKAILRQSKVMVLYIK
jgi:hypothetical protein